MTTTNASLMSCANILPLSTKMFIKPLFLLTIPITQA